MSRDLSLHEKLLESLEKGRTDKCWSALASCSSRVHTEGVSNSQIGIGLREPELTASRQVTSVIALLSSSSWTRSRWVRPFHRFSGEAVEEPEGDDHRATMRRLIDEGTGAEGYHDEPSEGSPTRALEASSDNHEESPRVVQSSLLDSGNEWRDDGEGHRD